MEILVKPDGRRDQRHRPYIDQEETARSIVPWNPYVPYHYGLYDSHQPTCDNFSQMMNAMRKDFAVEVGVVKGSRFVQPWSFSETGRFYHPKPRS